MYLTVYGSLRKGFFNHKYFGFNKSQLIKTIEVPNFEMYSLGYFPIVVPVDDTSKTIVAEIYNTPNHIYKEIKMMEESAGYREIEIHTGGFRSKMFIYDRKPSWGTLIPNGDWSEEEIKAEDIDDMFDAAGEEELEKDVYKELVHEFPELIDPLSDGTINTMEDLDDWIHKLSKGKYKDYDEFLDDLEASEYEKEQYKYTPKEAMPPGDNWLSDEELDDWINALNKDEASEEKLKKEREGALTYGSKWADRSAPEKTERPTVPDPTLPCECPNGIGGHWVWDDTTDKWVCMGCGMAQKGIEI